MLEGLRNPWSQHFNIIPRHTASFFQRREFEEVKKREEENNEEEQSAADKKLQIITTMGLSKEALHRPEAKPPSWSSVRDEEIDRSAPAPSSS